MLFYLRLIAFWLFVSVELAGSSELVFEFVQEDSSVLATLTLKSLSSDPSDILELTFSKDAQELFGYGPIYEGTFDALSLPEDFGRFAFEEDGIGLTGRAAITVSSIVAIDRDPPTSSVSSVADFVAPRFDIVAQDVVGGSDAIVLFDQRNLPLRISATGTWQLVPEPTGMALLSTLCVLLAFRRRRQTR